VYGLPELKVANKGRQNNL